MEPFVPNLAVKLNYLLGCPNNPHPAAFLALYDLPTFLRTAIADSSGIRDPIPLVKESTTIFTQLLQRTCPCLESVSVLMLNDRIVIILMKGGLDYRARIPRMLVPSVKRGHAANTPEIAYFHKIKGGPGLLEKYDFDMPVRTARQSLTSHNFYLSKRLQNLSRARPVRRELDSSRETKSARQKIVSHRNISRHD